MKNDTKTRTQRPSREINESFLFSLATVTEPFHVTCLYMKNYPKTRTRTHGRQMNESLIRRLGWQKNETLIQRRGREVNELFLLLVPVFG